MGLLGGSWKDDKEEENEDFSLFSKWKDNKTNNIQHTSLDTKETLLIAFNKLSKEDKIWLLNKIK